MRDLGMLSAAIHESGHAIISHALGCTVEFVEIHYSNERQRWEGSCKHKFPETDGGFFRDLARLKKGAKVSVAGILAQAKMIATRNFNQRVRFAAENDFASWFDLFSSRKVREVSEPGQIQVTFVSGSEGANIYPLTISGDYFGGADAAKFIECFESTQNVDRDAIFKEVIALLDRDANWEAVQLLADKLCSQPCFGDDQRREMDEESLQSLLASVSS